MDGWIDRRIDWLIDWLTGFWNELFCLFLCVLTFNPTSSLVLVQIFSSPSHKPSSQSELGWWSGTAEPSQRGSGVKPEPGLQDKEPLWVLLGTGRLIVPPRFRLQNSAQSHLWEIHQRGPGGHHGALRSREVHTHEYLGGVQVSGRLFIHTPRGGPSFPEAFQNNVTQTHWVLPTGRRGWRARSWSTVNPETCALSGRFPATSCRTTCCCRISPCRRPWW